MTYKVLVLFLVFTACNLSVDSKDPVNRYVEQLSVLDEGEDATPVILKLVEALEEGDGVVLPTGRYDFYPDRATDHYIVMSNNDSGNYRIAFNLTGNKDITIDGGGSEFIFHGEMIPFNIEDTENVILRNFSIDWERPFHSEAKVVANDKVKQTFDIQISEDYPYRMEGDQLIWLLDDDWDDWDGTLWRQNIFANIFFDPETGGVAYRVQDYQMNPYSPLLHTQYKAKEIEPGLVRIYNRISEQPEPGWIWVSKGNLNPNRQSPALRIFGSKNLELENINIHHAGAMGIIGERSENISLKNINVVLPEDKNRIVTTTADATHFVNNRGHISIDGSTFEHMLDDGTNIHGTYLRLDQHIDEYTIGVQAVHHQQNVLRWAAPGDTIVFRDNNTLEKIDQRILKKFIEINQRHAEMVFDDSVSNIPISSGVDNPTWYPSFSMTNSTVRNNRARSILLTSQREMHIENNTFYQPMMGAIVLEGDMNYWFESGNVTALTIRNNQFVDAVKGGAEQAVIHINPIIPVPEQKESPFHRNIIIEENVFETFDHAILHAFSTGDLMFRNNEIRQTKTYAPIHPELPAINIEFSTDTEITGNRFNTVKPALLKIDDISKSTVHASQNDYLKSN